MKPDVCIIILSVNLFQKLERCLNAVLSTGYKNLFLIIFDNGSQPLLIRKFGKYKKIFSEIDFIRSEKNIGFAEANNKALKYGLENFPQTSYFLLLNNDAYISKDFFIKSIPYLHGHFELLSPIIALSNNWGIDSMGITYYSDGSTLNRTNKDNNNFLLPAACLFVKREFVQECMEKFGWLFIPEFFSYAEDVELTLRAVLMGKSLQIIPHKIVIHDKSASSNGEENDFYLGKRNLLWTVITTWTGKMIRENIFHIIRGQIIIAIVYTLKFKNFFILRIYLHVFLRLQKLLKIRRIIQRNIKYKYPKDLFINNMVTLIDQIKKSRTYENMMLKE